MSTRPAQTAQSRTQTGGAGGRGGLVLAPALLILTGLLHVLLGITAIARESLFSANVSADYPYTMAVRGWGWLFTIMGVVAALVGFALFSGRTWTRATAIVLGVVSSILLFLFLPLQPLWSLLIIALNLVVIWAAATERGGILPGAGQMPAAGGGEQPRAREYGREAGQYRETGQVRDQARERERWPAENVEAGRHWTPEPAKEGAGMGGGRESAMGAARAASGRAAQGEPAGSEKPEQAAAAARARAAQAAQEAQQQQQQPRRNPPPRS